MPLVKPPNKPVWPPRKRVKKIHAVKPGESLESIAKLEGIHPSTLIAFNFRTVDPREVNWYLSQKLHCKQESADRKNYLFSGGEPIYVPESQACTVLSFSSRWTTAEIAAYQKWVETQGASYTTRKSYRRDCADFAITLLVEFAKTRSLPVAFTTGRVTGFLGLSEVEGTACITQKDRWFSSPTIDYDGFLKNATERVIASELHDLGRGNTLALSQISNLKAGDLLTNGSHVQVVLKSSSMITVNGTQHRVMEIVQGNLMNVPSGTIQTVEYLWHDGASTIQHRAWDLDKAGYYDFVNGQWQPHPDGIPSITSYTPRRWNFDAFNDAY